MNFEEEAFSQPLSQQPSLPDIIQQDRASIVGGKTLKFQILVKFFNRFSNMRGVKKSNYAKQFLKVLFKADRSPSFVYPIIRLMLPGDDRERGNYGLKQKNLSKAIADSLNLTKQDYLRLHHFKNPSFHKTGIGIGDFSLCAFDVVKSFCKQQPTLTIADLNGMLDELISSSKAQLPVFRRLFTICTAEEIKWIIRIILKDLKISIKIQTILGAFHPDAHDFFNLTNSLLETCKKFEDASVFLDDQIKIFFPIRPMLAGKKKINFFQQSHKNYYVETKFDGERLQAHKKGSQVKLFSRNAVDYSKTYEQFVDLIRNHVQADECILDGQIIVIEKDTLKMVPFGLNKVIAVNKDKNEEHVLCYKIFDVLWLKQEGEEINLMKFELKQRKQIMKKIVKQKQGVIQVVKYEEMWDYDDIVKRFSQSLDRSQEGIMLKDPHSLYLPKQRGSNWIKLKGDYIQGLTDTLDLIILGGYFGDSSKRHGHGKHWTDQITTFLLGVIERIDTMNSQIAYAIPFAKVGTGYSIEELHVLRQRLKDNLSKNQTKFKPPYLQCKWKPSLQDRPDCWVTTLNRSIVLQIKAAQVIVSDSYPTGHTLRFPRIVKIRYDKDWNEAQTLKNLRQLTDAAIYNKNLKRKLQDSDSDGQKQKQKQICDKAGKKNKRQKQVKKDGVYQQYFGFDMTNQKTLSHLFSGFQFCVFNFTSSKYTKLQIQRQIMLHAGEVAQNPLPSTQYIITDTIDYKLRAYQTQQKKRYTFIKPNYVINCINANKILPLSPLYLTVLPQGRSKYYMDNFDRFGDSYCDLLDCRGLDMVLDCMEGTFQNNQKLMDHIALKRRRAGMVSICFGLSQINKVKLKMNDNKIVNTFDENPNSIIIDGKLSQSEWDAINNYRMDNYNIKLEQAQDLEEIDIL